MDFLQIKNGKIVNEQGKEIYLRGVNLGGWLMMEGYILGGRNIAEHVFKKALRKECGAQELAEFENSFRSTFIQEEDFVRVQNMKASCVRIPFHYSIVARKQWKYLDCALQWAQQNNMYVILDLHAAPGAQNGDWHSDSSGRALLWEGKKYQKGLYSIWHKIARRYKNESVVAGYDVLNEPVGKNTTVIKNVYKEITKAIRAAGDQHIIFVEGNTWAQEFAFLGNPWDRQLAFSFHFYFPLEFTFNFVRQLKYPGKINGESWHKDIIEERLKKYRALQQQWNVPVYCGEFGVNIRPDGSAGELEYLKDVLNIFNKWGIHYTYWTYKAVAGGMFPDGIYQYVENPSWIDRGGLLTGVETWPALWKNRKNKMVYSWDTKTYLKQASLVTLLHKYFGD